MAGNNDSGDTPVNHWGSNMWKLMMAMLFSAALVGCATPGGKLQPSSAKVADDEQSPAQRPLSANARDLAEENRQSGRSEPTLYRGSDQQVKLPLPSDPVRFVGDDVSLNFEQAPLSEVVQAVMGDILELDYIVDHPVQGKVTLRTRTPIPRGQLLGVLESLLKAHNALLIRGKDGRYLVTGSQQAVRLSPQVTSAQDEFAGFSTIIVPLEYISASAMADILRPVADDSAFVRIDNARNLLMLAGTRAQLTGWLDIVSTFDVDMLAGMSVGIFPLENGGVLETAEALNSLIGAADGEGGDIAGLVRIMPVQRLNSILVVTPRSHYLERVGTWLERLDVNPNARFERRLFVYPVQNTTATRLAELLNGIYAGGSGAGGGTTRGSGGTDRGADRGVAPGMTPESIGNASRSSGSAGGSRSSATGGASGASGGAAMVAAALGGEDDVLANVRVVADEENNALMIYATGKQYEIIEEALDQLDVVATQIIIEASILEVTLTDELRYGLEWSFRKGLDGAYEGFGQLVGDSGVPSAVTPGFSYTVTNSVRDISAVLNALSQDSLINVISTPSVMVLDNHTAEIQVGDQVPVLQGNTVTNGGNTIENIVFKDTGVSLIVTPSVNAGGLVTMDVEQSVTDVGNVDSATGQRSFLERSIRSRVAVRSSESVVLGGLIRENASTGQSGLPLLKDIPGLGSLFGATTAENRRTELLVIITPRALYTEDALREVSEEMRSQVRFMELIEKVPAAVGAGSK
ncbi:type II secretion system secretin GspD [Pseudohaliea rubra]|uniref:General secretion pathway protein D n=1 Tax=Pseudohaliea rubra DSM 19751 TaxID=1265313 RepID=A0A095VUI9_9GAMM|nr:type II secretion system secretin GspD [Pseudohaliea rubra]KGE04738.1 General secretion pathway protein D [Pseudohaliea rubra DSM 19751]